VPLDAHASPQLTTPIRRLSHANSCGTQDKAVKVARVAPAEPVTMFGIGGLGHLARRGQTARVVFEM